MRKCPVMLFSRPEKFTKVLCDFPGEKITSEQILNYKTKERTGSIL